MEVMDPFEFAFAVTDGVEGCVHMLEEDGSFSCELDSAGVSVEESGSRLSSSLLMALLMAGWLM